MKCQHAGCRNARTLDGRNCKDGRRRLYCSESCARQSRRERRYARLRSEGLCVRCGVTPANGRALCDDCTEANNEPRRITYWSGIPMSRAEALQVLGRA